MCVSIDCFWHAGEKKQQGDPPMNFNFVCGEVKYPSINPSTLTCILLGQFAYCVCVYRFGFSITKRFFLTQKGSYSIP